MLNNLAQDKIPLKNVDDYQQDLTNLLLKLSLPATFPLYKLCETGCVQVPALDAPLPSPPKRPHPGPLSLEIHKPPQPAVIGQHGKYQSPLLRAAPVHPSFCPFFPGWGCCCWSYCVPTDRWPSHVMLGLAASILFLTFALNTNIKTLFTIPT